VSLLSSCGYFSSNQALRGEEPIARVGEDYLYESELLKVLDGFNIVNDSAEIAENYVDQWIRKKVLSQKAESLLDNDIEDINKQVDNYRNTLLQFAYEKHALRRDLDTVVSAVEIQEYYDQFIQNFELEEDIFKIRYVILDKNSSDLDQFKKWTNSRDSLDLEMMQEAAKEVAKEYAVEDWKDFDKFMSKVPYKVWDRGKFLTSKWHFETTDDNYAYIINMLDYKLKGVTSPLNYVKQDIYKIIVNKRKVRYLNELRDQVYKDAQDNNLIEIYER